nr:MAG TPA: hypothetical protein [Caudoviricetes sp.]
MNPNERILCIKRKKTHYDNFGSVAQRVSMRDGLITMTSNIYGLEFHRSLSDNDICIQPRGIAEDNEKYKQFIVQMYVRNASNTKAVLLRRLADNMLTPIQGHAGLPDGIDNEHSYLDLDSLYNNLYYNVCKETREEVTGIMPLISMYHDRFRFAYFLNDDINSRYHVACTFTLVLDDDVLDRALPSITSGEPEKHKVEIVDLTRIDKYEPIDPWLRALLDMERV